MSSTCKASRAAREALLAEFGLVKHHSEDYIKACVETETGEVSECPQITYMERSKMKTSKKLEALWELQLQSKRFGYKTFAYHLTLTLRGPLSAKKASRRSGPLESA
ncbi:MAG: hypothetical protein ACYC27_12485 [Armatimonadota bacterium]